MSQFYTPWKRQKTKGNGQTLNSSALADELFEYVWSFSGVGSWRVNDLCELQVTRFVRMWVNINVKDRFPKFNNLIVFFPFSLKNF